MSGRDVNRFSRSRSQIRGELPDRAPLDYFERLFDDEELPPARPQKLDFKAKLLLFMLALAMVVGIIGCWPRFS
ncbi:MAG: hypothetical protein EOQ95_13480 [Mesorhizobium sp.]|nr:MAG: hypothetical protein EOQ95_13480 [Mesorhizobium sp.]